MRKKTSRHSSVYCQQLTRTVQESVGKVQQKLYLCTIVYNIHRFIEKLTRCKLTQVGFFKKNPVERSAAVNKKTMLKDVIMGGVTE